MSLLTRTSVIIPALNEEETVAEVVRTVLADRPAEVIVIDSESTDDTAARAREAGARVVDWRDALPTIVPVPGKGEALWRGTALAHGEFIVFVDADLRRPHPNLVRKLLEPFHNPDIMLVKANYQRGFRGEPTGGGRVTELTARPLIRQFFPELAHIRQPLSGEYAMRTAVARSLPFAAGYGVEIGLLLDVAARWGVSAIAEADLGERQHRNRPLEQLAPMADVVVETLLARVPEMKDRILSTQVRPALDTLSF